MDKYTTQSLNKVKRATHCKSNRPILHPHHRLLSEPPFVPTLQITTATRLVIKNAARRMAERIAPTTLPCAITMPRAKAALTTVPMLQTISATTLLTDSLAAALNLAGH